MMDRITLKEYAKNRVNGRRIEIWKALIFTFLGSMVVSFIIPGTDVSELNSSYISNSMLITILRSALISSLITTFLLQPLTYGVNQYLMDFDKDDYGTNETIFSFYKQILKIFVLTVFINIVTQCITILTYLITTIFALLNLSETSITLAFSFVVIGQLVAVYLSFSFAAVPYIFKENKEKGIVAIMKLSYDMMKGHKMEYFILTLSFIGWYILSAFTCGILMIWVLPYSSFTFAKYFLDLKNEYYGIIVTEEDSETVNDEDPFTIG